MKSPIYTDFPVSQYPELETFGDVSGQFSSHDLSALLVTAWTAPGIDNANPHQETASSLPGDSAAERMLEQILASDDGPSFQRVCENVDYSSQESYIASVLPGVEILADWCTGRRKSLIHDIVRRSPLFRFLWIMTTVETGGPVGKAVVQLAIRSRQLDRKSLKYAWPNTPDVMEQFQHVGSRFLMYPEWFCWKYQVRNGKQVQVAYSPHTGERVSASDPQTWGTFSETVTALDAGGYDGFGYVMGARSQPLRVTEESKSYPQWVCYRIETHGDESTAVPYSPHTGTQVTGGIDLFLGTYEQAVATAETHGFDGVSFVYVDEDILANPDEDYRLEAFETYAA